MEERHYDRDTKRYLEQSLDRASVLLDQVRFHLLTRPVLDQAQRELRHLAAIIQSLLYESDTLPKTVELPDTERPLFGVADSKRPEE